MTTTQEKLFLLKEADKYFERNDIKPNKFILDAIKFLKPNANEHIFEIGCSTGATLNKIKSIYGSKVYGLDPSKKATDYAKSDPLPHNSNCYRHTELEYHHTTLKC